MEEMKTEEKLEDLSLNAHINNLKRELGEAQERIDFHIDLLRDLHQERDAVLGNHDIMMKRFVRINPDWEFETDEEFIKNLLVQQSMRKKRDAELFIRNEEQINKVIKVAQEQKDSTVDELKRLGVEV